MTGIQKRNRACETRRWIGVWWFLLPVPGPIPPYLARRRHWAIQKAILGSNPVTMAPRSHLFTRRPACPIHRMGVLAVYMAMSVAASGQANENALRQWTSYAGGGGADRVLGIATDGFGHVYVAGRATDGMLPGNDTTGQSGLTHQRHFGGGASDAFLAKYMPQGSMLWCTFFGGPGDDEAVQVVPVGDEGVYLVGTTTSADSIVRDTMAWQPLKGGGSDIFVAYFTWYGRLAGSTYIGGPGEEVATGAALDQYGRLVVTGHADQGGAFPDSIAPVQAHQAGLDGLVARFEGTHRLLGGTYIGGPGDDHVIGVVQGHDPTMVLAGNTNSTSGIASGDAMTPGLQGGMDAFVAVLDTGMAVVRATYFGGEADDLAKGLAHRGGMLALAGATRSQDLYATPSSMHAQNAGGGDGFLAVLDTSLQVQWSTFVGDTGYDALMAVDVDEMGRFYAAGVTRSPVNIATPMDSTSSLSGDMDAFVLRMDNDSTLAWSTYIGAMGEEEAHAMTVKGFTAVFTGGHTTSDTGLTHLGHQMEYGGGPADGFVARVNQRLSTPGGGICMGGGGGTGDGGGYGYGNGNGSTTPPRNEFHVCHGDPVLFLVYGGALGYDAEWAWYRDTCGVPTQFITVGDTLEFIATESFTLYARAEGLDHASACAYTDIIVHAIPEPVVTVSDTVCAGAPVLLHGAGAESFIWLVADSVVATGADTLFLAPPVAGWLHVEAVGTYGPACSVGVPDSVYVRSAPEADWQVAHIGCDGSPGMIALTTPGPVAIDSLGLSLAWQPADYEGPVITGLAAGFYVATLTDVLTGCSRTDTLHVIAPATLDLTWQVTPISCTGAPGAIHAVMGDSPALDSAFTFQWSQPGLSGPSAENLAPGLYIVTASDTMGCARTDSILLTLPPIASATWLVEGDTCAGGADGSITLVQPGTAFPTIAWAMPGLDGPVVNGLPAGTYFVTITDTLGCSRTDSLTVTAPPPLMDSVGTTYAYCDKPTGTAQVQSSSTAPGLVFDFGNGPDSSGYAENLPPGTYTVTASDSAGCTQVLTFTIESFGNITASIGADTLWAEDGSTVLTCALIPPDPLASFVWSPGEGLDAPGSATTTCTVQDTVTYVVHATSGAGCSAFDTVVVVPFFPPDTNTIAPGTACGEFFLPDIFSPNGDGLNDALCPLGGCITQLDWSIYDRWGQRVFEANTPDACWDGTRNGTPLPAGSYLFTFRAERSTGERIERTGTITLRK